MCICVVGWYIQAVPGVRLNFISVFCMCFCMCVWLIDYGRTGRCSVACCLSQLLALPPFATSSMQRVSAEGVITSSMVCMMPLLVEVLLVGLSHGGASYDGF